MPDNAPKVAIVSPFRESQEFIDGYIDQVYSLDYPPDCLRVYCVEGDSTDNTWAGLGNWAADDKRVKAIKHDTGRQKFPSSVNPERFRHLAEIFNKCIEAPLKDDWAEYILFIPSDVIWQPDLVANLVSHDKDVISPMFWIGDHPNGSRFYDIWGFRDSTGYHFPPNPYAYYQQQLPAGLIKMETVGGAMMTRRNVLEAGCRYTPEDVDHGLCWTAAEKGFSVWADTQTHIVHR